MKNKIKLLLILLFSNLTFAQSLVKMTSQHGSENPEINDLADFENIYIEKLNFESKSIIGKYYKITIDEYTQGKFTKSETLFYETDSEYFKIKSDKESIKFFFKMSDGKLKIYLRGEGFGSKKTYLKLNSSSDKYVVKNFLGQKKEINLYSDKKNAVFAIITPTIYENGSGSYCEVAQSNIEPAKLGEKFNIPHYFIVNIEFI